MLILDSFLLLAIIVGLAVIKFKYPNFLFFCKGAILFLPPDQDQPKQSPQKKSKKQKEQQVEIRIIQLQYNQVKDYPMCDEYDRVIFLVLGLLIYIPVKFAICLIVDLINQKTNTIASSSFTFIIGLVIMIYLIKLGLQIFWISSYNLKYCFLFTLAINVIFFMLYLTTNRLGAYDQELEWAIVDYRKLISIVVGKEVSDSVFNVKSVLGVILVINGIFTLMSIPAVIKFGNWYTKTLKEIYYEDETTSKISDPKQKKEKQQKQALLKKKSMNTIRLLNIYLVLILVFLFFSHNYCHRIAPSPIIDFIRIVLMLAIVAINCYTLRDAIEFNGSFAYKFISQYASTDDLEERKRLRQKIMPYLYFLWYHKFQFMFRVLIPVLLFAMLMDWKYMHTDSSPLQSQPVISHTHCGIQTNQLQILQSLYKCDALTSSNQIHKVSEPFINGMLVAGKRIDQLTATQEKIAKFGLLSSYFMVEFVEQVLWYTNITVYAMTIIYILFLRKTVYQI